MKKLQYKRTAVRIYCACLPEHRLKGTAHAGILTYERQAFNHSSGSVPGSHRIRF